MNMSFSLRALAAQKSLQELVWGCSAAAAKPVIHDKRDTHGMVKDQVRTLLLLAAAASMTAIFRLSQPQLIKRDYNQESMIRSLLIS